MFFSACMTSENKQIALNDYGIVRHRIVNCKQRADGSYHLSIVDHRGLKIFTQNRYLKSTR